MPKVEQYGGQQVSTQVSSGPRADASGGNATFKANQQVAQGLSAIAQEGAQMMQRFDTTSAEEALVGFERDKNKLFFDPDGGYFNTQGKNAFDNSKSTAEALVKLKKQYGEKLNPNSRGMFDKSADAHIIKGEADIMRHSAKGMKAWEVATINSQVENTVENASLYWNQPEQLAVQNALGRQAILDSAELEGIGSEATNERLQTFDSSFNRAAILTATSTSAEEGQALFEKHGAKLEGPDRLKIETQIQAKAKAEKIQRDSQQAVLTGTKIVDQFDSREDIRNEVNKIEDPELRSKTLNESMRQFNIKKQGESEAQSVSFESAETHIYDGGSAETYKAEDPEGWERLSAKQKKSLESGKMVSTNWAVYSDLMMLPKNELAQVNPADHLQELGPTERGKLISAVKSAKGLGSAKDKVDHQIGRTRTSQTTNAIEKILGKRTKWNDDERMQADSFYDLLDTEVQYREQQKDAPLTSEEFTDTLSDLTRKVTIERSAFGIDFLAPDVDQSVTDIPPQNMRALSQYLRDNGIPVTADNLVKAQRQATK